jgi:hypothetical protein
MSQRKTIDPAPIEREYRAGQLSVSAIARQNGVSDQTVHRLASRLGWVREAPAPMSEERRRAILARFSPPLVLEKLDALVSGTRLYLYLEDDIRKHPITERP